MKDLFTFELIVLIIIDLIYIYCGIFERNFDMHDFLFGMCVAHLFLGPFQFIPALVMLRKKANRNNNHFTLYFILAIVIIGALILNIAFYNDNPEFNNKTIVDHQVHIQIFAVIQISAWLLAHYFVYVLHILSKNRNHTSPIKAL